MRNLYPPQGYANPGSVLITDLGTLTIANVTEDITLSTLPNGIIGLIKVAGFGGADDSLKQINAGSEWDGKMIMLEPSDDAVTITLVNDSTKLALGTNKTLDSLLNTALLVKVPGTDNLWKLVSFNSGA